MRGSLGDPRWAREISPLAPRRPTLPRKRARARLLSRHKSPFSTARVDVGVDVDVDVGVDVDADVSLDGDGDGDVGDPRNTA